MSPGHRSEITERSESVCYKHKDLSESERKVIRRTVTQAISQLAQALGERETVGTFINAEDQCQKSIRQS